MGTQSGVVFGFIFAAFIVYITLKGELPTYAGLLLLSPPENAPQKTAANATQSSADQAASLVKAATTAAEFLALA